MDTSEIYKKFSSGCNNVISLNILIDNQTIDISSVVNSLSIHRYEESVKAIYVLDLSLPLNLVYKMEKNKEWKFSLDLYSTNDFYSDIVISSENEVKQLLQRSLFLQPFNHDDLTKYVSVDRELELDSNNTMDDKDNVNLIVECFEYTAFFSDLELINVCYTDVTMQDVIMDLIVKSKLKLKSTVITKIQNSTKYEQVFIPPMPFFKALKHLIETYSLHKTGTKVFLENECLYIIEKDLLTIKNGVNSYLDIMFTNNLVENSGESFVKNGAYMYATPVSLYNNSDIDIKTNGSKIIYTDKTLNDFKAYTKVDNKSQLTGFLNKKDHEKQTIFNNKKSNKKFAIENMQYESLKNSVTTQINLFNVAITKMDFDTCYNLSFAVGIQNKFSDLYFPEEFVIFYTKTDDDFISNAQIKLHKRVKI